MTLLSPKLVNLLIVVTDNLIHLMGYISFAKNMYQNDKDCSIGQKSVCGSNGHRTNIEVHWMQRGIYLLKSCMYAFPCYLQDRSYGNSHAGKN